MSAVCIHSIIVSAAALVIIKKSGLIFFVTKVVKLTTHFGAGLPRLSWKRGR